MRSFQASVIATREDANGFHELIEGFDVSFSVFSVRILSQNISIAPVLSHTRNGSTTSTWNHRAKGRLPAS
jgi:hypothetical protein